jgi:hypothetical protein
MFESSKVDELRGRAAKINEWLDAGTGSKLRTQLHLDRSTAECAYWHLGYQQALSDIVRIMSAPDAESSTSHTPN